MFKSLVKITDNNLGFLYSVAINCLIESLLIVVPLALLVYYLPSSLRDSHDILPLWLGGFLMLYILRILLGAYLTQSNTKAGYEAGNIIREATLKHVEKLSLSVFDKKSTGDLHDKIIANVSYIEMMISHFFPGALSNILSAFFTLALMAFLSLVAAMILLIAFCFALILLYLLLHFTAQGGVERISRGSALNSKFLEYLRGIVIFKAFNLEGEKFEKLQQATKEMRDYSFWFEIKSFSFSTAYSAILEVGFLLSVAVLFARGESWALILVVAILALQFLKSMHAFITDAALSSGTYGAVKVIAGIYDLKSIDKSYEESEESPTKDHLISFEIEFDRVNFGYEGKSVLKDLSFKVPERSLTAIVGKSGVGKSTIFNLMARFYELESGSIKIGGRDFRSLQHLNRMIAMVFQDTYLFNDTIFENIRIAKEEASLEEVKEACERANIHEFISSLQEGYETIISEGGESLSGGQKQRIALARALLKDAPILLLDEVSASLDGRNEQKITEMMSELRREKTILVITHKLDTIKNADQILFIEEGRVAESGSFEELLRSGGHFKDFWHKFEG